MRAGGSGRVRGAAIALALLFLGRPDPTRAQDEPAMPEAPHQYKLGAWAGGQVWGSSGMFPAEIDDHPVIGLDVERLLVRFASLRFGVGYASTSATDGDTSIDLATYVFDFDLRGRLAFEPLRSAGITPIVLVSAGAVVHDPDGSDRRTRSQTALGAGGAVELNLTARVGAQADWRHLWVNLEDAFDPTSRESEQVDADRFTVGLYWRF